MTTTLPPSGDTPAELAEHLASGARLVEAFHLMPGVARAMREAARLLRKPCTCHPDDNPPVPCPQKFALSECKAAAPVAAPAPDALAKLSDAELIEKLRLYAYRSGTRQNTMRFLHFQTADLVAAVRNLPAAAPAAPAPDDDGLTIAYLMGYEDCRSGMEKRKWAQKVEAAMKEKP